MLLHLFSFFLHNRSLLVPYGYSSVESNDCILLSSFGLKAILFISSVKSYAFHFEVFVVFQVLDYCFL